MEQRGKSGSDTGDTSYPLLRKLRNTSITNVEWWWMQRYLTSFPLLPFQSRNRWYTLAARGRHFHTPEGTQDPLKQHVASQWSEHLMLVTQCNQDTSDYPVQPPRTCLPNHWLMIIILEDVAGKQSIATDSPTSVTCVQRETAAGSAFRP